MKFMIGKIRLPIVQDNIEIKEGRDSTDINILNGKTITVQGNNRLTEISYSSFFPKNHTTLCDVSSIKAPTKYVSMIKAILNGDNYVRVNIPKKKINIMCQITDFDYKPKANGDIDYSIQLKEFNKPQDNSFVYVPPTTSDVIDTTATAFSGTLNGDVREVKIVNATTYTVKTGDCLVDIARLYNMQWIDLYNDNKDVIGNDPNLIYPGQVLKVRGTAKTTENKITKVNNVKQYNGGTR